MGEEKRVKQETHWQAAAMVLVRDDNAQDQKGSAEKWSNYGLFVESDLSVECMRCVR